MKATTIEILNRVAKLAWDEEMGDSVHITEEVRAKTIVNALKEEGVDTTELEKYINGEEY